VVVIASNGGDVNSLISRCTILDLPYVTPKAIPYPSHVKGASQVGIARGNISGNPTIGGIAHVSHIKRVKYNIIICTDPAGRKMVAPGIAMITNGHIALLHSDVGPLLANVDT